MATKASDVEKEDVKPTKDLSAIEKDVAHAKARQAVIRKEAPASVKVGSMWKNPHDQLISVHCPECIGEKRTHDAFIGTASKHRQYLDKGYEPVIHEGEHLGTGVCLVYRRPVGMLDSEIKQADTISQERVKHKKADEQAAKDGLIKTEVEVSQGPLR